MMTEAERREHRLASWRRYNASRKGQQRNQRYEQAHPDRRLRWEPERKMVPP
jgi:hypothetical protein